MPETPATRLRRTVWELDRGSCVACGVALPRRGTPWDWHVHHVVEKQTLRRRGHGDRIHDENGCVLVCLACHAAHTAAMSRIPGERLPERAWTFAAGLGDWATDLVRRYHPSG